MADKIFADGLRFDMPGPKAPGFVKGKISVNAEKFIQFINTHRDERGWLNLDVKESKGGKVYVELNTYKRSSVPSYNDAQSVDEAAYLNTPPPATEDPF